MATLVDMGGDTLIVNDIQIGATTPGSTGMSLLASGDTPFIHFSLKGVNFNSATTDNAIAITLPTGYTRYAISAVTISNASHTLVTATCGVFNGTGGASG